MTLVTSKEFADSFGTTPRTARNAFEKALSGKLWRGHRLPVLEIEGQRGGCRGKVLCLELDLAPPEIQALFDAPSYDVECAVKRSVKHLPNKADYATHSERLEAIAPILATAKRTDARKAAFTTAVDVSGYAHGTLANWVTAAEKNGTVALLPSRRSDAGKKRVLVTRKWDDQVGLDNDIKQRIADALSLHARSMIANDGTSRREIVRLSGISLQRLSAEAGSPVPLADLPAICKLNDKWAKPFEKYRLVHMHKKDHAHFQDRKVPRIRRELHEKPMGLLMGDVHYVDIMVEEADEPIRVRMIAWMDMASMFIWVTPVFLSKGQGVRQEDVAESLAQVTMCPFGGIPDAYYLDNGPEYSELPRITHRLGALADMVDGFKVTLAKAYSPQSKGDIENCFHVLQGLYQSLDGYIGGDRTNKKSANKGKVVQPYRHGLDQLEADILAIIAIYNDRPQAGRLKGVSPVQALENAIEKTGFVARVPDEDSFDVIFSKQDTRTVRQGCINLGGEQYRAEFLDEITERDAVEILIPLRNRKDRVFVRHHGRDLGWAEALPRFAQGDTDGARLQHKLERETVAAVKTLRKDIDPLRHKRRRCAKPHRIPRRLITGHIQSTRRAIQPLLNLRKSGSHATALKTIRCGANW